MSTTFVRGQYLNAKLKQELAEAEKLLGMSRDANAILIGLNVKLLDERDRYRAAVDRIGELMDAADYEDVEQEIRDVLDVARRGK